jgi:hypothetical protein
MGTLSRASEFQPYHQRAFAEADRPRQQALGVDEKEVNIRNKLSRGKFTAASMSYRYWIIAATLGLVFLTANPEQNWAQERNDAQTEKIDIPWPPYGAVKDAPNHDKLTEACDPGSEKRDSDLCAQWKAADAAKKAADWSVYLGLAASFVAILTLAAAVMAARYAKDATLETRRIGEAQLRAYVVSSGVSAVPVCDGDGRILGFHFAVQWRNAGQTPAMNCQINSKLETAVSVPPFTWDDDPVDGVLATIGPSDKPVTSTIEAIKISDIVSTTNSGMTLYTVSRIIYDDVFERGYVEEVCFSVRVNVRDRNIAAILTDPTKPQFDFILDRHESSKNHSRS